MKHSKKVFKSLVSLVVVLLLVAGVGFSALAAEDDFIYDNYNRVDLADYGFGETNVSMTAWTGVDKVETALEEGALKLDYSSLSWFGTGGGIEVFDYKYLVITMKGKVGGEGADFNLNYAAGTAVTQVGKTFAEFLAPDGNPVPAITTEYQDIVIDLEANAIDPAIQALHFNFGDGKSGTLWIDQITFTKEQPDPSVSIATPLVAVVEETVEPVEEPATPEEEVTTTTEEEADTTTEEGVDTNTEDTQVKTDMTSVEIKADKADFDWFYVFAGAAVLLVIVSVIAASKKTKK